MGRTTRRGSGTPRPGSGSDNAAGQGGAHVAVLAYPSSAGRGCAEAQFGGLVMLTRRTFSLSLGAVAASTTLPILAAERVSHVCPLLTSVHVFFSDSGSAATTYSRALPASECRMLNVSHGLCFHDAAVAIGDRTADLLAGLTRDSEFMLLSQLAEENGFVPTYKGSHCAVDGYLQHALSGSSELIERLERQLLDGRVPWAEAIARSLDDIAISSGVQNRRKLMTPDAVAGPNSVQWVTWGFRRSAA